VLTSDQKGAVAEAGIAHEALRLGIGVSRPLADEFYDLILDLRSRLLRVQCKWATKRGGAVVVECHRNRRNADGLLRQLYPADSVDAFAAYCGADRSCYLIPTGELPPCASIRLRDAPARNNQQSGIRWASDFEFAAKLQRLGP
jgi:hypothetical protein